MCAITRNGQLVAHCASVERCFHVNLLRRLRRVLGETGDDAKAWEEDIVDNSSCYCMHKSVMVKCVVVYVDIWASSRVTRLALSANSLSLLIG
jgi:hypothetical protein